MIAVGSFRPDDVGEFDAFAGGYPVPPMGDQVLPEFAQVLTPDEQRAKEGSEA